jgi:hypothetical protein
VLATDRSPPFTPADVPDYLAGLNINYPTAAKRWLPLVKWLLAFPHYILVARLSGPVYPDTLLARPFQIG